MPKIYFPSKAFLEGNKLQPSIAKLLYILQLNVMRGSFPPWRKRKKIAFKPIKINKQTKSASSQMIQWKPCWVFATFIPQHSDSSQSPAHWVGSLTDFHLFLSSCKSSGKALCIFSFLHNCEQRVQDTWRLYLYRQGHFSIERSIN